MMTIHVRRCVRVLVALTFSVTGLIETLSATGLTVELSPDGHWGTNVHTLAISGPLQLAGGILLAFGRKTRWALTVLGSYVFLVSVFGYLPSIVRGGMRASAIAGLLGNLAVLCGVLYCLHEERTARDRDAKPALSVATPAPERPVQAVDSYGTDGYSALSGR